MIQCCNQSDEYSAFVMLHKDFHNSFSSHLCTLAQFFNPSSRNFLNTPLYFTQLAAEYNRLVMKYDFYSDAFHSDFFKTWKSDKVET